MGKDKRESLQKTITEAIDSVYKAKSLTRKTIAYTSGLVRGLRTSPNPNPVVLEKAVFWETEARRIMKDLDQVESVVKLASSALYGSPVANKSAIEPLKVLTLEVKSFNKLSEDILAEAKGIGGESFGDK